MPNGSGIAPVSEDRKALAESCVPMVRHIAQKVAPMLARKGSRRLDFSLVDDAAGEGYLALMDAARNYDPERGVKFVTYAYRVVSNRVNSYLRKVFASRERSLASDMEECLIDLTVEHLEAEIDEQAGDASPLLARLEALIARLPEKQRVAFAMRHIEDMTVGEIRKHLGCEIRDVKTLICSAEQSLRQMIRGGK